VRGYNRRWADAELGKLTIAARIAAAAIFVICGNLTSKAFVLSGTIDRNLSVGQRLAGRKTGQGLEKRRLVAILTQSRLITKNLGHSIDYCFNR
jgi:hypothetical protein